MRRSSILLLLIVASAHTCCADDPKVFSIDQIIGHSFKATDSLDVGNDPIQDARDCLDALSWKTSDFSVQCQRSPKDDRGDMLVRFPSPIVSGDQRNDSVSMEWYLPRDKAENFVAYKAIVVVHESGSSMPVGRMFANGLRQRGFHTFLIHLPYYGQRRTGKKRPEDANLIEVMRQSVADVRRARDAIVALPLIDASHVSLQGTSLGGFVSATAAGMDDGYDSVFITLAGGNLYDMIQNGKKDAAKVRERLAKKGLSGEKLRSMINLVEPTRLAHRLDRNRTWLYSGTLDTVVPPESAMALATAAGLDESHHIKLYANHYSGIIYLPWVLHHIRDQIHAADQVPAKRVAPRNLSPED